MADYFGCSKGEFGAKNTVKYNYHWGKSVNVPTIDDSHWLYECEITKIIELEGSHLFLADIKNIQIDKKYGNMDMDMEMIDLREVRPAIYSPYNYFAIGEKLGDVGEWKKHLKE